MGTKSYLKNGRLADVVAAIQVMGVYSQASRPTVDWEEKLGKPLSARTWDIVFHEHPEFFRLSNDGWASLRWRHGFDLYDAKRGEEVTDNELGKLSKEQKDKLTRKSLDADQIEALLKTAVEFHSSTIALSQERRWLVPLLFGLGTALLSGILAMLGTIVGALLHNISALLHNG